MKRSMLFLLYGGWQALKEKRVGGNGYFTGPSAPIYSLQCLIMSSVPEGGAAGLEARTRPLRAGVSTPCCSSGKVQRNSAHGAPQLGQGAMPNDASAVPVIAPRHAGGEMVDEHWVVVGVSGSARDGSERGCWRLRLPEEQLGQWISLSAAVEPVERIDDPR